MTKRKVIDHNCRDREGRGMMREGGRGETERGRSVSGGKCIKERGEETRIARTMFGPYCVNEWGHKLPVCPYVHTYIPWYVHLSVHARARVFVSSCVRV